MKNSNMTNSDMDNSGIANSRMTNSESKQNMSNSTILSFVEMLAGWLIARGSPDCISVSEQRNNYCELEELAEDLEIDFLL